MGHRKTHAPRHGSLAYLPRKRAKRLLGEIRFWPKIEAEAPRLLGFVGYKAGMTHVFAVEDRKRSPDFGKEVMRSATVLETPPMLICAVRAYTRSADGLRTKTEAWMKDPPDDLDRILTLPESFKEENMKKIDENLSEVERIRVIAITQPKQTSVPKKKPDMVELEIGGGTIQQRFEYAKSLLGKTVTPPEIFKEGQHVDVIAISVGKGFQGPVKRFGVTKLQHKGRKTKRGIATLGPWNPHHVMYSVARAGQMGFHQRTEHNKRILKIGNDGKDVTPKGGFIRYGIIKGPYMLLEGSIAGTEKRPIRLRYPARPPKNVAEEPPQILQISLESPQGK
ncbi:MAG: 50S ribosomal protein L3 [Candidatus Bathyarchaeota archaeon]|nr:50S ribosomal protein L3 [Candidatus Bathyarchaeota archaeon]